MECREVEDLLVAYHLGALDSEERRRLDSHLDSCPTCSLRLQGDGETVARLASTVPQPEVPPVIKRRLLSAIETESPSTRLTRRGRGLARLVEGLTLPAQSQLGKAVSLAVAVVLVLGGVWFNNRLNRISQANEEMHGQIQNVVEREEQVMKMVSDQRYLSYMTAAPGVSVSMLRGTQISTEAWGMIACCAISDSGTVALLAVLNLPPLPSDQVYEVWLVKDGQKHSAGVFTVDSTGYGQSVIIPVAPMTEFDGIAVTVEYGAADTGSTGIKVLEGDL